MHEPKYLHWRPTTETSQSAFHVERGLSCIRSKFCRHCLCEERKNRSNGKSRELHFVNLISDIGRRGVLWMIPLSVSHQLGRLLIPAFEKSVNFKSERCPSAKGTWPAWPSFSLKFSFLNLVFVPSDVIGIVFGRTGSPIWTWISQLQYTRASTIVWVFNPMGKSSNWFEHRPPLINKGFLNATDHDEYYLLQPKWCL